MSDFRTLFARAPTVSADAPGRVNLIGEHTDYNGGFVLPTAIPQRTHVELAPRSDQTVRVWSSTEESTTPILEYRLGAEGGSVVLLAHAEMGALVAERIAQIYEQRSERQPRILVPALSG